MERDVDFAAILGEVFALVRDAAREVALYVVLIGGVTAIGVVAGLTESASQTLGFGFEFNANDSAEAALFDFAMAIASFVGIYFLSRRFLALRGRLRGDRNRLVPYFFMEILWVLGVTLGFLLLIIPGIIFMVRWSASSGYLVGAEESITGALGSSWRATAGHSWSIFFASIALFFGLLFAAGVAGGIAGIAGDTAVGVVSSFMEAAGSAIFAALGIAIYSLVEDDTQELREVFA